MVKKVYNKLVRNRIPEIIRKNGDEPTVRILEPEEYRDALKEKVREEAQEVFESRDKDELVKELGDLYEVCDALKIAYEIDYEDVSALQTKRREQRGGFEKRIFLESVDE